MPNWLPDSQMESATFFPGIPVESATFFSGIPGIPWNPRFFFSSGIPESRNPGILESRNRGILEIQTPGILWLFSGFPAESLNYLVLVIK